MAEIQFSRGIKEDIVPEIRLTRAPDGSNGTATFYFESPNAFNKDTALDEITGMYMIDEEGEIVTREVKGKFRNGVASAIEAVLIMKSADEWDRFMRFMERYGKENGLEFTKSNA